MLGLRAYPLSSYLSLSILVSLRFDLILVPPPSSLCSLENVRSFPPVSVRLWSRVKSLPAMEVQTGWLRGERRWEKLVLAGNLCLLRLFPPIGFLATKKTALFHIPLLSPHSPTPPYPESPARVTGASSCSTLASSPGIIDKNPQRWPLSVPATCH